MAEDEEPRAYSMAATARLASVSVRTIQNLLARGDLRSITVGRRRLIPRSALAELLGERDELAAGRPAGPSEGLPS